MLPLAKRPYNKLLAIYTHNVHLALNEAGFYKYSRLHHVLTVSQRSPPPFMSHLIRTRSVAADSLLASDMGAAPTVTVTQIQATSTSNPYDSSSGSAVTKIVPGVLIAFFCFASLCLTYVLVRMRQRRRRRLLELESQSTYPSSANSQSRPQKPKKKRFVKPMLWDVEAKDVKWEADLEALHPVAVELQADPWPQPKTADSTKAKPKKWFVPGLSRPHPPQEMQQAQVTFMVAMPAPGCRDGEPVREIALGTAFVPYQDDESDDEDEVMTKVLDGSYYPR